MEENLLQIKLLRKRRLFLELLTQTEFCGLEWSGTTAVGQYTVENFPYTFFLTPTSFGITLDVLNEGQFMASYNSSIWADVQFLYDFVAALEEDKSGRGREKSKEVLDYLQTQERDCA